MIYLIQDCYEDQEGNFQKILKIGYSSKTFDEGRKSQYDTHNFGYKLLSEREGSLELERYLHRILQKYHLSLEWFKYDPEIIKIFNEVSEEDISQFKSQEELNEYIRDYILENLIPSTKKLSNLYLKGILEELHEKSKKDPELEYNENLYRKEILEVFKFVSSKEREYFENLNFDDKETKELLSNIGLNLSQIVGRQRDKENPFKNNIVIFYKLIRTENLENRELFDEKQNQRKDNSKALLSLFVKGSSIEKSNLITKLKDSIQVSQYSNDFISISKKTGLPVYNSFIEIANERAWEVSQKDYQDKITVTKSIFKEGYTQEEYRDRDDKIVSDFLDNHFYMTGIFEEKMKLYCEFMDTFKDNVYILDQIIHKVDPKFKTYYDLYGTSGCRSVRYQEIYLKRKIGDIVLDDKLKLEIINTFPVKTKITKKEIKQKLSDIYKKLGITRTPKASDLGNYLKLKDILIPSSPGKRDSGYEIIGIL